MKINSDISLIKFYPGLYNVFFIGGFYVKLNKNFKIDILNVATSERVNVNEKFFKLRTYRNGRRAIKYYDFVIVSKGVFQISIHNFEDLVAKKSILWSKRLFQKRIDLDELEILIEQD